MRLALDAALAGAALGPRLAPDGAAVIGRSLGGYTALALAGGHPLALPNQHAPPYFIERVLGGLPAGARLDYQVVPGASHFAFFGRIPAALARANFPPAYDPPGFERAAYQPRLHAEVLAFLRDALAPAQPR